MKFWFVLILAAAAACSSDPRRPGGRGTSDAGSFPIDGSSRPDVDRNCTPTGAEASPETCGDGIDNDCDGLFDCSDIDCSGIGTCPVCGQVDTPLGSPLALPDGVGNLDCSTDADCPGAQRCFTITGGLLGTRMECRESYRSTLNFIGFGPATFDGVGDIERLCVVMEHSYLRDLEITLEAPNGQQVRLQQFLGQEGGEIYLGQADDCDGSGAPTPGTGMQYCWAPGAGRASMLEYANGGGALNSAPSCSGFGDADMMPPGDYSSADDWSNLIGAPLNGEWTLSVTDLWPADNGYIFEWSISFNPRTVEDCSSPLI
ncbi:MAG: proprotein convertase P-domain-containing protein [Myxococcota bacterium]